MFDGCVGTRCGVVGRKSSCFSGYVCTTGAGEELGDGLSSLSRFEKLLMNEETVDAENQLRLTITASRRTDNTYSGYEP